MDSCDLYNVTIYENSTLLGEINYQRAQKYTLVITYLVILTLIGIFGNSLVIYIYGTKFRRTSTTYFVLWLAILDLLSCVLGLPFEVADVWYNSYFTSSVMCKIARFFATLIIISSALCLLVVAFDRYFKVCKPHRRPPFSSLKQVVGLTIVITILFSWPTLFTFGIEEILVNVPEQSFVIRGSICSSDENTLLVLIRAYWLVLGLIFILSSVFMVTVYTMLICSLYKREADMDAKRASGRSVTSATSQSPNTKNRAKIGRTTRLFVCITAVFILSFLPMLVLIVVETVSKFCELSLSSDILVKIFIRSQYLNNVANPFLYGFYNPLFRRECKLILYRRILVNCRCVRYNFDEEDHIDSAEDMSSNALNTAHAVNPVYKKRNKSLKKTSSMM